MRTPTVIFCLVTMWLTIIPLMLLYSFIAGAFRGAVQQFRFTVGRCASCWYYRHTGHVPSLLERVMAMRYPREDQD